MPKRKQPRQSLIGRFFGAILSLFDALLKAIGDAFEALMRLLGRLIVLLAKGLFLLIRSLLHLLSLPFVALYRGMTGKYNRASRCLRLTGEEFERYIAEILEDNGFKHVQKTIQSGDQGVDILCERGGHRYAIQCKNYQGAVGNAAVQEAYAGMCYYDCDIAVVLCPGRFTASARELADSTGVLLWGEKRLTHMMQVSGKRPKSGQ